MKRLLIKAGIVCIALGVAGMIAVTLWYASAALPVGTGYVAKYLCSSTFISERDPAVVFEEDIKPVNPLARVVRWSVDAEGRTVTARALRVFESRSLYREGVGCTLIRDVTEEQLRGQVFYGDSGGSIRSGGLPEILWPDGEASANPETLGVDRDKLERALDSAFAEPEDGDHRKTRAVVIVYQGKLIGERYAPGFHEEMPLLGWSMAKSVTNALVGILVMRGDLALHDPAPVMAWQDRNDPRREITLDHLMGMVSGLDFVEEYEPLRDAVNMLYGSSDFAAFASSMPLKAEPGSLWNYSSGNGNIIASIVRAAVEKRHERYYDFFHRALFDRIGMISAVLEPDPSGTFVGSSYVFATPRDWARFGLLYLQDGVWEGERILPEGWVDYSRRPVEAAPRGEYGALFWLNAGAADDPDRRLWPDVPRDAFAAQGFQEQRVIIIPSRDLVLVRFGATSKREAWDTNAFVAEVLKALPEE